MRRSMMSALLAAGAGVVMSAAAADDLWEPKLPFRSAVIHYDVSGTQAGSETLYIRDAGRESVKITRSEGKMMFVPVSTNTIEITSPESIVRIDMNEKTGMRTTNPQKFIQQELAGLSGKERATVIKNLDEIGMNMAAQLGGQVERNGGTHLGYACDVVSVMGSTSCQMSGTPILLKMETALAGMKMATVATRIDKDAQVPDDVFRVPAGIKVEYNEQADNVSRDMIRNMITAMKDPNAASNLARGMSPGAAQAKQAERQRPSQAAQNDTGQSEEMPSEEEVNKMMEEGMKVFKGMFGE